MLEWAATSGKAVRQQTVCQETTMFKAGMLPLIGQPEHVCHSGQPTEKITMERTLARLDAAGNLGCPVEGSKKSEEENRGDRT